MPGAKGLVVRELPGRGEGVVAAALGGAMGAGRREALAGGLGRAAGASRTVTAAAVTVFGRGGARSGATRSGRRSSPPPSPGSTVPVA